MTSSKSKIKPVGKTELMEKAIKTEKSIIQCNHRLWKLKCELNNIGKELGSGTHVHVIDKNTYVLKVDWHHNVGIVEAETSTE